jgi:hypothetical protein
MVSSLEGGALLVVFDSEQFVESATIVLVEGVLLFSFVMQLDCFSGLGGSEWVIGVRVYDGIKESFLQSFFEESYGADVIEWYFSISSDSFEV